MRPCRSLLWLLPIAALAAGAVLYTRHDLVMMLAHLMWFCFHP